MLATTEQTCYEMLQKGQNSYSTLSPTEGSHEIALRLRELSLQSTSHVHRRK